MQLVDEEANPVLQPPSQLTTLGGLLASGAAPLRTLVYTALRNKTSQSVSIDGVQFVAFAVTGERKTAGALVLARALSTAARTADQARADIGEIMEATTFGYNFDMRKAKETGFTRKIKKVKQKTVTIMGKGEDSEDTEIHTIEIELYDAQAAIDKVLRVAGKYKDSVDITSGGKTIKVVLKDEDEQ